MFANSTKASNFIMCPVSVVLAEDHCFPGCKRFESYIPSYSVLCVVKPFETRPATTSTKKASGFCILCSKPATTEALFHVYDVTVFQRYCDGCLRKAKYEVDSR